METAVTSYAEYRAGDDRDLLGRFVVPASRLDEFADCLRGTSGSGVESTPWQLSAIVKDNPVQASERILSFNARMRQERATVTAICDSVELSVAAETEVADAVELFRESFRLFLEVRTDEDPAPLLQAIGHHRALAKMRTGGITETAFPSSAEIIRFIAACNRLGVPFKATAGLHHAVRAVYPLTYERDSACGMMFGFLNVFLASAFIRGGMQEGEARAILDEQSPAAFTFDDDGASWRGRKSSDSELSATRMQLALSFGSCSFVEPVEEARSLGLL
jgi:hypothetical protein